MLGLPKLFLVFAFFSSVTSSDDEEQNQSTTITTRNVTTSSGRSNFQVILKEINEPHNLFIGRCKEKLPILHQEQVFLNSDGESQISANIRMNVEGSFKIVCVKIFDEDPEVLAYPSYAAGGIGYNFIEFNVLTTFGKGFKFFVQIFGEKNPIKEIEELQVIHSLL